MYLWTSMGAQPEYASGEVIANKYVVEGPLGESPSGRSYLAHNGTSKLVIKTCRPELSERLRSAPDFFLKAGVATEVEHDNLVACLDVQEEMGMVFTARAHVEGQDFEEWARRNRKEGNYFTRGLELLWQACQGLAALHERSRHLNIHPGNLLVTPLMAKLADWDPRFLGSMEMTPEPHPFRPEFAGYRAPEMPSRGSFLTYPSTDLYAVAGLLFRLTVGEHPARDPAANQARLRSLDEDVARFLGRALHPRPEERFQEAADFSDALWGLQGAMTRLQERSSRGGTRADVPSIARTPPIEAKEPRQPQPDREATLFGSATEAAPAATPPKEDDSFFNFFPTQDAPPVRQAPVREATTRSVPQPPPPPLKKPAHETLFGASSLEAAPSGDTLFGAAPEPPSRQAPPPPQRESGGLSSLEEPGTLFGGEPTPPPPRRGTPKGEPAQAALSLSSLEKDPLELAREEKSSGFTQFGFKGAGESRTLFGEDPKVAAQRKLYLALGIVGLLVLMLALGGLFWYLRGAAAPEMADQETTDLPEDPAPSPERAPEPGPEATPPAGDKPPYPEVEPVTERASEPSRPQPVPEATPPKPGPTGAARGTPERLAELMRIIETRDWPATAAARLQVADELNDFGKVAEANVVYGRVMQGAGLTEKQKVSALGGLAATFRSMGMKDQALDAAEQILAINPRNAFALRLKEQLK